MAASTCRVWQSLLLDMIAVSYEIYNLASFLSFCAPFHGQSCRRECLSVNRMRLCEHSGLSQILTFSVA